MEKPRKEFRIGQMSTPEMEIAVQALVRNNKSLRVAVSWLAIAVSILTAALAYNATREVEPLAFGLTVDGRAIELTAIEGDLFKPSTIIAWAKEKSEKMYSFNFRSVEGEWPNSLDEFLYPSAKNDWINSLRKQGYLTEVIEKRALMYANVDGEVLYRGKVRNEERGIDVSVVEVPLRVVLDARGSTTDRNREFRVTVQLNIGHVGFANPKYAGLAIGSFKLAARR